MFETVYVVFDAPYGRNILGVFADHPSAWALFKAVTRGVDNAKFDEYVTSAHVFKSWSLVGECDE